jgi:F-type H+-transporting ATPase subunit alpha
MSNVCYSVVAMGDALGVNQSSSVTNWAGLYNDSVTNSHTSASGFVLAVGDGVAVCAGLDDVMLGEIVEFLPSTVKGMALTLNETTVSVVVFGADGTVKSGDSVKRGYNIVSMKVGKKLCGRVIDSLGNPLDGLPLKFTKGSPTFRVDIKAPGLITRAPVNVPLYTGIKTIDCLIPIGCGQRELIIGDRQTGKTSIALDTIINQRFNSSPVHCVYVVIGQKRATVAHMVKLLKVTNAFAYTTVVAATSSDSCALQFLAPYSGCTVGEWFRDSGGNGLVVYDDLSKHAVAYRQMSLLLRRAPGREAYPGDVFYLHSRLLERSAQINASLGGGSLTALPIIETLSDDVSAYIPTNVISITDGQIFLDNNSFIRGKRPAIYIGLSVSRIGAAAQTKLMKSVFTELRGQMAQYAIFEDYEAFEGEVDPSVRQTIDRGIRLTQLLNQQRFHPFSVAEETLLIYAGVAGWLDVIDRYKVQELKTKAIAILRMPEVVANLSKVIPDNKPLNREAADALFSKVTGVE